MKKTLFILGSGALLLNCLLFNLAVSQNHSSIAIVSKPITVATVGFPYAYTVKATSNRSADTIRFRLSKAPQGMKVDSLNGVISWTPVAQGNFRVEVLAYTQRNDKASQSYSIRVAAFFGTITGVIKDDSGKAIRSAHVILVPQSPRPMSSPAIVGVGAETDSLGHFTILNVDSGKYFAQAVPPIDMRMSLIARPIYLPVWYVDSPTMSGATAIPVANAATVTINFTLHRFVPPIPAIISGTVRDTAGKPIREATVVVFMPPPSPVSAAMNADPLKDVLSTIGLNELSIGCFPFFAATGRTDSAGKYIVKVVAGGPYIAAAYGKNFQLQYFKGKNNGLDADRMTLTKDSSGVDFNLAVLPKITTKVSGSVKDSAGLGIVSKVILYPTGRMLPPLPRNPARTVHTDSLGRFVFEGVPNGSYLLQAVPFAGYLPSFYKANACGVLDSRKLDTIIVKGSDVNNVNVCVKKGSVHGGGKISGRIRSTDNAPFAGVVVIAQSVAFSDVRSYSVSDGGGSYEIADLDAGSYEIAVDKVGFQSLSSVTKSLDFQHGVFTAEADFQLSAASPTLVGGNSNGPAREFSLYQNYPNPFNPSTEIVFNLPASAYTTLKIFNMLGQEVRTLVSEEMAAGVHSIEFSASLTGKELPTGVYIYQLRSGNLNSAKKMLLMK